VKHFGLGSGFTQPKPLTRNAFHPLLERQGLSGDLSCKYTQQLASHNSLLLGSFGATIRRERSSMPAPWRSGNRRTFWYRWNATLSPEVGNVLRSAHEPLRMEAPDLLCVAGHGTFTGPDLSHSRFLLREDAEGTGAYCSVILIGMSTLMPSTSKAHTHLTPLPMLPQETLSLGRDVGKFRHSAGFLSRTLLVRQKQFEGCPTFAFEQARQGLRSFGDRLRALCAT